ncbi:MAG: hypothetical protein AAFY10_05505 [Pseudomonadota bacterium]
MIRVRLKIAGTQSGLALLHETVDGTGRYLGVENQTPSHWRSVTGVE